MQIVIDIPDFIYAKINSRAEIAPNDIAIFEKWILDGKPLPKGHGRLIDADDLFSEYCEIAIEPYINAPTIIEADKEGTEE